MHERRLRQRVRENYSQNWVSQVSSLTTLCCQQDTVLTSTVGLPGIGICSSLLSFSPPVPSHLAQSMPLPTSLSSDPQHPHPLPREVCPERSHSWRNPARQSLLVTLFQTWLKTELENTSLKLIRRLLLCYITGQTFQLCHTTVLPLTVTWYYYTLLLKEGLSIHFPPKQFSWPSNKRHKNIKPPNLS